jgi:exosortase
VASPILFGLSVVLLLMAVVFLEPPLAALSFALGLSSFLLRVKDSVSGGSLFPISLLMYVVVHSPFGINEDRRIITLLQRWSAQVTSVLLDVVRITHDMPGTILRTTERSWGVEEACSGVQSFYTLLFCSVFLAIWLRRPAFRGLVLVASSLFWALVMNTLRIFLIPIAYFGFGIDLSEGWQHAVLGYFTLIMGILMLLSTDQFLDFVFGSIDAEKSGSETEASSVGRFWNRYVAGQATYRSQDWKPSAGLSYFHYSAVALPALVTLVLSPGLFNLMRSQGIDFFRKDVVIKVDPAWFPEEIEGWKLERYEASTRERGSDLGQRSDVWLYRQDGSVVTFSFDQAFPGWHELTTCYQNSELGWQIARDGRGRSRLVETLPPAAASGAAAEVSLIEVDLIEPTTGRQGYLLFGLDDAEGVAINAPGDWSIFTSIAERLKNRFAYEIRASFFRSEGYQTQIFIPREVSADERLALRKLYLSLRALAQERIRTAKQAQQFWTGEELASMHNEEKARQSAAAEAANAASDELAADPVLTIPPVE